MTSLSPQLVFIGQNNNAIMTQTVSTLWARYQEVPEFRRIQLGQLVVHVQQLEEQFTPCSSVDAPLGAEVVQRHLTVGHQLNPNLLLNQHLESTRHLRVVLLVDHEVIKTILLRLRLVHGQQGDSEIPRRLGVHVLVGTCPLSSLLCQFFEISDERLCAQTDIVVVSKQVGSLGFPLFDFAVYIAKVLFESLTLGTLTDGDGFVHSHLPFRPLLPVPVCSFRLRRTLPLHSLVGQLNPALVLLHWWIPHSETF